MKGRLNIFQRTMLQWDSFYPYNAIGIMRIPARLEEAALKDALRQVLERQGIGSLEIDPRNRMYEYLSDVSGVDLTVVDGDGEPVERVRREAELQLNTRFVRDGARYNPFRFFACAGGDCFYFGIVYYHVIADGYSMAFTAREIVRQYLGQGPAGPVSGRDLYPGTYSALIRGKGGLLPRHWLRLPLFMAGLRRASKPFGLYHTHDRSAGCSLLTMDPAAARAVARMAITWGVTQHDIFQAIIYKVISPFVPSKKVKDRKKNMALGSVINIGRDLGVRQQRTFGVFLSSFAVLHSCPGQLSLEALSRDIHAQSSLIRKDRRYLMTLFEQWVALKWMPFLPREQQMKFYPKNYPLWAGVTHMNFRTLCDDLACGSEVGLTALVSTGPNCPVIFAITRVRDTVNIGITYRREVFSQGDIAEMTENFLRYTREMMQGEA